MELGWMREGGVRVRLPRVQDAGLTSGGEKLLPEVWARIRRHGEEGHLG